MPVGSLNQPTGFPVNSRIFPVFIIKFPVLFIREFVHKSLESRSYLERGLHILAQKEKFSPVFSLLTGNLGGERFAL